jgi:tetratricopeptide (TPR) repeat protein
MADRFMYIPAAGIYLILSALILYAYQSHRFVVASASAILAFLLASQTHKQIRYWQDSIQLFSRSIQVTNNNWVMLNSLGAALSRAGRHTEAAPYLERALEINPQNAKALFNLGNIRFYQERWHEAAKLFERSLALTPNYQAQYNLAVTYKRNGNVEQAKNTYLLLLEKHPQHIPSLINLGRIYREEGKHAQAIACYRLAQQVDPGNVEGRTGEAISLLQTAEDPMPAIAALIRLLQEDASNSEAREALNEAVRGSPADDT